MRKIYAYAKSKKEISKKPKKLSEDEIAGGCIGWLARKYGISKKRVRETLQGRIEENILQKGKKYTEDYLNRFVQVKEEELQRREKEVEELRSELRGWRLIYNLLLGKYWEIKSLLRLSEKERDTVKKEVERRRRIRAICLDFFKFSEAEQKAILIDLKIPSQK